MANQRRIITSLIVGGMLAASGIAVSGTPAAAAVCYNHRSKSSVDTYINDGERNCDLVQARISRYVGGTAVVTHYYGFMDAGDSYVYNASGISNAGNATRYNPAGTAGWTAWSAF